MPNQEFGTDPWIIDMDFLILWGTFEHSLLAGASSDVIEVIWNVMNRMSKHAIDSLTIHFTMGVSPALETFGWEIVMGPPSPDAYPKVNTPGGQGLTLTTSVRNLHPRGIERGGSFYYQVRPGADRPVNATGSYWLKAMVVDISTSWVEQPAQTTAIAAHPGGTIG